MERIDYVQDSGASLATIGATYRDDRLYLHCLGKELSAGGQGIVYRTEDPDIALKLLLVKGEGAKEILRERYLRVRCLPMPEGISIAAPMALLRDSPGYVMPLLQEMTSLDSFTPSSAEMAAIKNKPDWISPNDWENCKYMIHYRDSGGLRKRLAVLRRCALILARLHAVGLVYMDLSPSNVFMSPSPVESDVWLIDADNIDAERGGRCSGHIFYTPFFGAPEIVRAELRPSAASDAFSFAVIAFKVLSCLLPFSGEPEEEDNEDSWDSPDADPTKLDVSDIDNRIQRGEMPWIDDTTDKSRSTANGPNMPRELVLTDNLKDLFVSTFEAGKNCRDFRPTLPLWERALADAEDRVVICPHCGMHYYAPSEDCPYCQTPVPPTLELRTHAWRGEGRPLGSRGRIFIREIDEAAPSITIPTRQFTEAPLRKRELPALNIAIVDDNLIVSKSDGSNLDFSIAVGRRFERLHSSLRMPLSMAEAGFWISSKGRDVRMTRCAVKRGSHAI